MNKEEADTPVEFHVYDTCIKIPSRHLWVNNVPGTDIELYNHVVLNRTIGCYDEMRPTCDKTTQYKIVGILYGSKSDYNGIIKDIQVDWFKPTVPAGSPLFLLRSVETLEIKLYSRPVTGISDDITVVSTKGAPEINQCDDDNKFSAGNWVTRTDLLGGDHTYRMRKCWVDINTHEIMVKFDHMHQRDGLSVPKKFLRAATEEEIKETLLKIARKKYPVGTWYQSTADSIRGVGDYHITEHEPEFIEVPGIYNIVGKLGGELLYDYSINKWAKTKEEIEGKSLGIIADVDVTINSTDVELHVDDSSNTPQMTSIEKIKQLNRNKLNSGLMSVSLETRTKHKIKL